MDASTPARRGERPAEELARKLDRPMGALGLVFVVVLTGQLLATNPQWSRVFTVIGWIFWAAFAGEFALRAYVAKDQRRFWRRNWWQLRSEEHTSELQSLMRTSYAVFCLKKKKNKKYRKNKQT